MYIINGVRKGGPEHKMYVFGCIPILKKRIPLLCTCTYYLFKMKYSYLPSKCVQLGIPTNLPACPPVDLLFLDIYCTLPYCFTFEKSTHQVEDVVLIARVHLLCKIDNEQTVQTGHHHLSQAAEQWRAALEKLQARIGRLFGIKKIILRRKALLKKLSNLYLKNITHHFPFQSKGNLKRTCDLRYLVDQTLITKSIYD